MTELKFQQEQRFRYNEAAHVTPNSELYKAQDLVLNRNVALKKVKITGNDRREIQKNYQRAMLEVGAMVQIAEMTTKIPNIFGTYYDEKKAELYIIMQWIGGETLARKMERKVPPFQAVRWMEELCRILDIMGRKRFVHKDIKPENIMFDENGELYLIDFNITVSAPNQEEGTLHYRAPEMEYGSMTASREKADQFAVGVILYQQFTGRVPQRMIDYDIYDTAGLKWDFYTEPVQAAPETDRGMNRIITKLMAYNPGDRYRSYSELIRDLRDVEKRLRNAGRSQGRN